MIFKKKYNYSSSQGWISYENKLFMIVDVREIIFTPEFMEKYLEYLMNKNIKEYIWVADFFWREFINHLHDPVTYLYNLLFNK